VGASEAVIEGVSAPRAVAKARNSGPHPSNPGIAFSMDPVEAVRVNLSAAERRVASLPGRRTVKKDAQAAWLLKAITCIDLTTLNGDDTAERVRRLCAKAKAPLRADIVEKLGFAGRELHTGAVCVYHRFVGAAVEALDGSGIPVAAVSTGFPRDSSLMN
jgi:deoxyribose-phosphate aldolase